MTPEPEVLSAVLVEKGILTGYQSKLLSSGRMRSLVFSGKYNIIDRLGTGGMGCVYLCEHRVMRRRVAIKVLPTQAARDANFVQRFHREARAVAALDHPNIVRAYDVDCDGKTHFLVMEFVEGLNLGDYVEKRGKMSVNQAASCIVQARGRCSTPTKPGWFIAISNRRIYFSIARAPSRCSTWGSPCSSRRERKDHPADRSGRRAWNRRLPCAEQSIDSDRVDIALTFTAWV